jgi:hypothetical protein
VPPVAPPDPEAPVLLDEQASDRHDARAKNRQTPEVIFQPPGSRMGSSILRRNGPGKRRRRVDNAARSVRVI